MSDGSSWEPHEDDYPEAASLLTFDTTSTVWGPGALTGKFLKAVGEIGLDTIVEAIIRLRLSVIKKTLKKRPAVFLELGPQDAEESRKILRDLEDLCGEEYSDGVRVAATALMDVILVYQNVPVLRQALVTKHRIFSKRQNKRRDEEDIRLATQTFEALLEIMNERSDNLGLAAGRLVESITKFHLESRALQAKQRRMRALALARDVEHIEHVDIMVRKETKTVYMDEIRIGNISELPSSASVRSNYNKEDENAPLVTEEPERMTDSIDDVNTGQIPGLKCFDVRTRSVMLEKNAMAHYLDYLDYSNSPICPRIITLTPSLCDSRTDTILEVIIKIRLAVIKKTLKKRPAVFLELESQDAEASQRMLRDLEDMCGDDYSNSVRAAATTLKDVILVYQHVLVLRQALVTNRRTFSNSLSRDAEDKQLATQTFEALFEFMNERYDYLGVAARRLVESITNLCPESRTLQAKQRRAGDLEYIEHVDIVVTKETKKSST